MAGLEFSFSGQNFTALGSGALHWADQRLLVVSDLHLQKSDRIARREGRFLPPYDTRDTLDRLHQEIDQYRPGTVICLGDSFDDLKGADTLADRDRAAVLQMQAGRDWIWIEGNHDPGPIDIGGRHLATYEVAGICFRHIAAAAASAEISGHYHPKATLKGRARPCFLFDQTRLILPAFGTYTGGLYSHDMVLGELMKTPAYAILTGHAPLLIPMPRSV